MPQPNLCHDFSYNIRECEYNILQQLALIKLFELVGDDTKEALCRLELLRISFSILRRHLLWVRQWRNIAEALAPAGDDRS
jgi:hypothetical protein